MVSVEHLAEAVLRAAAESGRPASTLSLAEIAAAAGISRSTLVRQFGGRAEIDAVLAGRGVDRSSIMDRLLSAAESIIVAEGVAALTVEQVADRAECTVATLYAQLGGRDALLIKLFDRVAVLPRLKPLLIEPEDHDDLRRVVEDVYRELLRVGTDGAVTTALIIDAVGRRGSALARHVRGRYLPEAGGQVSEFLDRQVQAGRIRPIPTATLIALFLGPAQFHLETTLLTGRGVDEDPLIMAAELATAFLRAVATAPDDAPAVTQKGKRA